MPYLAEATLGIHAVRVLLAVRADVPLPLADEARGVGEAPVLLPGLGARPQRMLGRPAVEADARGRLSDRTAQRSTAQCKGGSEGGTIAQQ